MAALLLGPLLRYAGRTTATVWVETDAACEVEILGQSARTFEVSGHHYALVPLEGLPERSVLEYEVRLDGEPVWPLPDSPHPPSAIHTREGEDRARLVFGSCRVGAPEREPYTRPPDEEHGFGVDALWAYSRRLQEGLEPWPDGLLLCGDQVYADEVSPETLEYIRSRRDTSQPPGEEIADFEEYTRLYREAWTDADIRWLFSTVPSLMVFDDHDVIDDWNISWQWLEDIRSQPWWRARITGAYMAYWVYQHLGNLAPPELGEDEMYRTAMSAAGDIGPELERFAERADRESAATRWASSRDFGRSRVIVVDSRAARVLDDGHRELVDEDEWAWIADRSHEAVDHLVIVSTLPVFLAGGIHYLEAWNEAVCAGAWGRPAAWLGERLRRAFDLEHWAAFQVSFTAMVDLLRDVATGSRGGRAPASITLVGGDIHNAYIAEVSLGRSDSSRSRVHQLVCSPFRNPLSPMQRRLVGLMSTPLAAGAMRGLARLAGVKPPSVRWRYRAGPTYHNSIGIVELDGRRAEATIYRSEEGEPSDSLRSLHTRVLAEGSRARAG
ncbi:MAG TPA: alkaline phosphatase D family protein [Gaiellales bacterium]|nr:alkaline phosphatase D family protein [Gaiellales bacterium]